MKEPTSQKTAGRLTEDTAQYWKYLKILKNHWGFETITCCSNSSWAASQWNHCQRGNSNTLLPACLPAFSSLVPLSFIILQELFRKGHQQLNDNKATLALLICLGPVFWQAPPVKTCSIQHRYTSRNTNRHFQRWWQWQWWSQWHWRLETWCLPKQSEAHLSLRKLALLCSPLSMKRKCKLRLDKGNKSKFALRSLRKSS